MPGLARVLRLTPAEIRERVAQAAAKRIDRSGMSRRTRPLDPARMLRDRTTPQAVAAGVLDAGSLAEHARTRVPALYAGLDAPDETIAALRERFPDDETSTVAVADELCAGRVTLFGVTRELGSPPDWWLEPVTGLRFPDVHWSAIDELDRPRSGEYKVTWELNRHQMLVTLGRAYRYTGRDAYADTFTRWIRDWIRTNPAGRGTNWASALEVSYRAISWLWTMALFRDSGSLDSELHLAMVATLERHGWHLERYLSTYYSPNTHLTGEALGLFLLGTALPYLDSAERWADRGARILTEQAPIHIRPDGTYFEQASYYLRYTLDLYLHLVLAAERSGSRLDPGVRERLALALEHAAHLTRPDGTLPFFGDDDGGRFLPLDDRPLDDARSTLATGAVVMGSPTLRFVAGELAPETLWLAGPDAVNAFDGLRSTEPPLDRGFEDGGVFVMRSDWTPSADHLVVHCGPHGVLNGGHAHADLLSFEAVLGGRRTVIDPGTGTYTLDPELRNALRGPAAHAGLTVDGRGPADPAGPFTWQRSTDGAADTWERNERFVWFRGHHQGFGVPGARDLRHTRSVWWCRGEYWLVVDEVEDAGPPGSGDPREMALRFPLHPDVIGPGDPPRLDTSGGRASLALESAVLEVEVAPAGGVAPGGAPPTLTARLDEAPWAPAYARIERAPVLVVTATGKLPVRTVTLVGRAGVGLGSAGASTAGEAAVVQLGNGWTDRLFLGGGRVGGGARPGPAGGAGRRDADGTDATEATEATDAEVAWIRTDPAGAVRQVAAIGGAEVRWGGVTYRAPGEGIVVFHGPGGTEA